MKKGKLYIVLKLRIWRIQICQKEKKKFSDIIWLSWWCTTYDYIMYSNSHGWDLLKMQPTELVIIPMAMRPLGGWIFQGQPSVNSDHGGLHQVSCRALDGGVDGLSLCLTPGPGVGVMDGRQVASAASQGLDIASLPALLDHWQQVVLHPYKECNGNNNLVPISDPASQTTKKSPDMDF